MHTHTLYAHTYSLCTHILSMHTHTLYHILSTNTLSYPVNTFTRKIMYVLEYHRERIGIAGSVQSVVMSSLTHPKPNPDPYLYHH